MKLQAFEKWTVQEKQIWPSSGEVILASHDEDSVVVYQAFNRGIAEYAVAHQRFAGCPNYNPTRMTWIKPGFLWMMYRCGWARKDANQERVLAIRLKRPFFERLVKSAETAGEGDVRVQWDPDHYPTGEKHPGRRAIQLGIRGEAARALASGEEVESIEDCTTFVLEQHARFLKDPESLMVPVETVLTLTLDNL